MFIFVVKLNIFEFIIAITGGPLNHHYKLIQFHAHWGKDCHCGSEHIIDGKHYSAEVIIE